MCCRLSSFNQISACFANFVMYSLCIQYLTEVFAVFCHFFRAIKRFTNCQSKIRKKQKCKTVCQSHIAEDLNLYLFTAQELRTFLPLKNCDTAVSHAVSVWLIFYFKPSVSVWFLFVTQQQYHPRQK